MKNFICFFLVVILFRSTSAQQPVSVIFDTDMGPDYDDVGAITILHAFADSGKAKILATISSTNYEGVAAVLSVLNTYFKKPGIPIGVPKKNARDLRDWQHWTDTLISNYPHPIKNNSEVPDATVLFRKVLSEQPDSSVTIITIGFFTNIANLLRSSGDEYSKLDGLALVKKKVKLMVSMAGKFPSGTEFNVEEDKDAAKYALDYIPIPVLFSGFEIGEKIHSGMSLVQNLQIQNSPVKDVFRMCIPMAKEDSLGRRSWDQTAVLVGINGFEKYYTGVRGHIIVHADGSNTWTENNQSQIYLVEKLSPSITEELINHLMMHQPQPSSLAITSPYQQNNSHRKEKEHRP